MSAARNSKSKVDPGSAVRGSADLSGQMPLSAPHRIRPELNLEKWPIWQPAHSKNKETRTFTRILKVGEGNRRIQEVTVHYVDKVGTLTTEDQKTYYALVKHWEEAGRLTEWTFFSLRQLAKLLNKKWGTNVIESLTQSLTRLRTIGIIWSDAYYDGKTKSTRDVLDPFTVLSKIKIVRRKTDGHVTTAVGYFRFDDDILNNLLANYTKPVILDTVLGFKSELAQVLYTYLDLILADKTFFERRTKELFEELGLSGSAYVRPGKRKQVLEPAVRELQAVPLTTGRIASIRLEETKDGADYKVIVRKGRLVALPVADPRQAEAAPLAPDLRQAEAEESGGQDTNSRRPDKTDLQCQAEDLVTYFYQLFHTGKNFHISSKACGQAISLISQHGFEASKYVVEYAKREAPQTHFDIQAFGGIIQYSSRAITEFREKERTSAGLMQTKSCPLCDGSSYRMIRAINPQTRQSYEAAKRCTHDPLIEAKHPSIYGTAGKAGE